MSEVKQGQELTNLVVCYTCKTIEEAPYTKTGKYLGDGKYDQSDNPFLPLILEPHERGGHMGRLFDIDAFFWMTEKGRKSTVEQIKQQLLGGSSGLDVFGTDFYNVKATYSEDAMSCYALHNRPQGQCSDYKIDRKIIKPNTDAERKEGGLAKSKSKIYLCDFCPVKMYNQKKAYTQQGLYE